MALSITRWLRVISVLAVLSIFSLAFTSAIASDVETEFEKITNICIPPNGRFSYEAAACYAKYDNEIGHELQRVYDRLRDILGSKDGMLREAQKAWLKFQEKNCAFVEEFHVSESRGWAAVNRSQCLLRTTLDRKFELEDYLESIREESTERQKYENCLENDFDQSLKWRRDYCARKYLSGTSN